MRTKWKRIITKNMTFVLRMLVCLMLFAVCVPGVRGNVSAATKATTLKVGDITEKGEVLVAASKKRGESYKDTGFPVNIFNNSSGSGTNGDTDDAYSFSTETGGTLTLEYSMEWKETFGYDMHVKLIDADDLTAEALFYDNESHNSGYSNSVSISLSPGTYIISSYFFDEVKASLNIYFDAYQIGITIPENMEMQKSDTISLNDVLTTDPIEFLDEYKSVATWTSSDDSVATVDKSGKVTAVSTGTAGITITLPGNATATCTITVTEPVENAVDIFPKSVQLSKTSYTWNGKARKPKVTVLDQNGNVIPSDMITLKTYYNNMEVGTAKVFVAVTGGTLVQEDGTAYTYHATTFVKKFKIKAAKAKKVTVKKKTITYKTVGTKQKVTVYDSKGKKISVKHYTVTYSNTIHAGKVKVTVKMDKCYGKKKFTTNYTIKVNSKTAKLFPGGACYKFAKDGTLADLPHTGESVSYSYTKQSEEMLKKLLKYGDKDIVSDEINYIPAVYNRTLYREVEGQGESWGSGDPLKFTGTLSDLIQCCIMSKITNITAISGDWYEAVCEDGTECNIYYTDKMLGMKSGYIMVEIWGDSCPTTYAYIKK